MATLTSSRGRSRELGEHLPSPALAFYDWRLSARDGDGAGDGAGIRGLVLMVVQSALSYLIHSAISAVCKPDIYYNVVSRNINQRLLNLTLNIHVIFMYLQYDQLPPL